MTHREEVLNPEGKCICQYCQHEQDERWQAQDELLKLDGSVIKVDTVPEFIKANAELLRAVYAADNELLWIGFGLDSAGDSFTLNLRWE